MILSGIPEELNLLFLPDCTFHWFHFQRLWSQACGESLLGVGLCVSRSRVKLSQSSAREKPNPDIEKFYKKQINILLKSLILNIRKYGHNNLQEQDCFNVVQDHEMNIG